MTLAAGLPMLASRIADRMPTEPAAEGPDPSRRAWRSITNAVVTVLASAGELRARDIHLAVEALLGEPVSSSSVKNCLASTAIGERHRFERVGRGWYRLAR